MNGMMPPPSCEPGATGTLTSALQAPPTHSGRRSPLIPCALAPPVYQAIGYAMPRSSCYCTLRANSRGERSVARLDTAQRSVPDRLGGRVGLGRVPRRGVVGDSRRLILCGCCGRCVGGELGDRSWVLAPLDTGGVHDDA